MAAGAERAWMEEAWLMTQQKIKSQQLICFSLTLARLVFSVAVDAVVDAVALKARAS